MKKLFTLCTVALSFQSFSQIVVNSWQYLGPSEIVVVAIDEEPSIVHTPAGPNQTWNYGELNQYDTDTIAFGPSQWFIGNQEFPNANYGSEQDGTSVFFRKNDEGFDLMGIYGDLLENGQVGGTPFTPYQRQVAFPMTYGQTWDNVSVLKIKSTDNADFGGFGDSLVVTVTTHREAIVDAWGTINTPLGSFSTLRMHIKDSTIQSAKVFSFGFPIFDEGETTIDNIFTFISNDADAKYNLLQYNYAPVEETLSNVQWQMTSPLANVASNYSLNQPEIYPNPANQVFKITNLALGDKVTILGLNGQITTSYRVSDKNMNFQTSDLVPGTYTVLIHGKSGLLAKKLIINK